MQHPFNPYQSDQQYPNPSFNSYVNVQHQQSSQPLYPSRQNTVGNQSFGTPNYAVPSQPQPMYPQPAPQQQQMFMQQQTYPVIPGFGQSPPVNQINNSVGSSNSQSHDYRPQLNASNHQSVSQSTFNQRMAEKCQSWQPQVSPNIPGGPIQDPDMAKVPRNSFEEENQDFSQFNILKKDIDKKNSHVVQGKHSAVNSTSQMKFDCNVFKSNESDGPSSDKTKELSVQESNSQPVHSNTGSLTLPDSPTHCLETNLTSVPETAKTPTADDTNSTEGSDSKDGSDMHVEDSDNNSSKSESACVNISTCQKNTTDNTLSCEKPTEADETETVHGTTETSGHDLTPEKKTDTASNESEEKSEENTNVNESIEVRNQKSTENASPAGQDVETNATEATPDKVIEKSNDSKDEEPETTHAKDANFHEDSDTDSAGEGSRTFPEKCVDSPMADMTCDKTSQPGSMSFDVSQGLDGKEKDDPAYGLLSIQIKKEPIDNEMEAEKNALSTSCASTNVSADMFDSSYPDSSFLNDSVLDSSLMDSSLNASPAVLSASTHSPRKGRQGDVGGFRGGRSNLDVEKLQAPFDSGWRRELVKRGTFAEFDGEGQKKSRPCDVYYHPPTGAKLRSMVEVINYLKKNDSPLKSENFSFMKMAVSKPPFEVIRNAGEMGLKRHQRRTSFGPPRPRANKPKKDKPEIVIETNGEEFVPKLKIKREGNILKVARPNRIIITPKRLADGLSPPENEPPIKKKMVAKKSTTQGKPLHPIHRMVAKKSTTQATFMPHGSPKFDLVASKALPQICTVNCPGLNGDAPSLQCKVCMCLFHPTCVNIQIQDSNQFTCLRCLSEPCETSDTDVPSSPTEAPAPMFNPDNIGDDISSMLESIKKEPLEEEKSPQVESPTPEIPVPTTTKDVNNVHVFKLTPKGVESTRANNVKSALQNLLNANTKIIPSSTLAPSPIFRAPIIPVTFQRPSLRPNHPLTNSLPITLHNTPLTLPSTNHASMPKLVAAPGLALQPKPAVPTVVKNILTNPVSKEPSVLSPPPLIRSPASNRSSTTSSLVVSQPSNLVSQSGQTSSFQNVKDGQLLTLPTAVIKRLNLAQPLSLKIHNATVTVPPSCFFQTGEGLKVFVPASTFPLSSPKDSKDQSTSPETEFKSESKVKCVSTETDDRHSSPSVTPVKPSPDPARMLRKRKPGIDSSMCFFKKLYGGYDCMWHIFEYLSAGDLLGANRVCKTWKKIISHPTFWHKISLRDTRVLDWAKAISFFEKKGTESLCLKGLLHSENWNKTWHDMTAIFSEYKKMYNLTFGLVPVAVLHTVCEKCSQLESLKAEYITDYSDDKMWSIPTRLDIGKLSLLRELRELRIRGMGGLTIPEFSFIGGMSDLTSLIHLEILSLTSLRSVPDTEFTFIKNLRNLKVLELGDCHGWNTDTFSNLSCLTELRRLRLECGGDVPDNGLAEVLPHLKKLEKIELIVYSIADSLEAPMSELENLRHLVIWPDTERMRTAKINSNTLQVIHKLVNLQSLEWGVMSRREKNSDSGLTKKEDESKDSDNPEMMPFLLPDDPYSVENSSTSEQKISVTKLSEVLSKYLPDTNIKVYVTKIDDKNKRV